MSFVKRVDVRNVLPLIGLADIGAGVSGERPVVRVGSSDSLPASREHAEMELARRRGVCVTLYDDVDATGAREQKTAWLQADGRLVLATWHQDANSNWLRGQSFEVRFDEVPELFDLLARNGF